MAKQANTTAENTSTKKATSEYAFGKENYLIMIVGLVVMAIGFLLMVGGGSDNPDVFNMEMFNFRRLTLGPIVILLGILIEVVAIFKKPKE